MIPFTSTRSCPIDEGVPMEIPSGMTVGFRKGSILFGEEILRACGKGQGLKRYFSVKITPENTIFGLVIIIKIQFRNYGIAGRI